MYVTDKNGRKYRFPSEEEDRRIRQGISNDQDSAELTDEQMAELRPLSELRPVGRPKAAVTKQPVSIRLSPEVVAYFKATGKGWQTRLDEVLRAYVAAHR
jgi:uncharacterized protein (DUF4415 family)